MPKQRKKPRKPKLAGRIRELASKDPLAARLLAQRGIQFTDLQSELNLYYHFHQEYKKIAAGEKTVGERIWESGEGGEKGETVRYRQEIKKIVAEHQQQLCHEFLMAVDERNWEIILEIANAVKFLKSFKDSGDPFRASILMYREILPNSGQQWTARQLARVIGWPMADSANGFYNLKRMAKELKFPLKRSTQIAKK